MSIEYKYELSRGGVWFGSLKGSSSRHGNELHPYHEIIFFLGASGKILCEQFEAGLTDNSLFVIPANTYHRVIIEDEEEYKRLLIHFRDIEGLTDTPLFGSGVPRYIKHLPEDVLFLLKKITDNLAFADKPRANLIYGAFMMLLSEIEPLEGSHSSKRSDADSELLKKCIDHIDKNPRADLSASSIARAVGISESSLYYLFKRNLGISLHKYITEKRISYAHSKIRDGALPTKIYRECGYNDYASFYKAYRKLLGRSPSEK